MRPQSKHLPNIQDGISKDVTNGISNMCDCRISPSLYDSPSSSSCWRKDPEKGENSKFVPAFCKDAVIRGLGGNREGAHQV